MNSINRRNFLTNSAMLVGGLMASTPLLTLANENTTSKPGSNSKEPKKEMKPESANNFGTRTGSPDKYYQSYYQGYYSIGYYGYYGKN